jgi:hypothetical protein
LFVLGGHLAFDIVTPGGEVAAGDAHRGTAADSVRAAVVGVSLLGVEGQFE